MRKDLIGLQVNFAPRPKGSRLGIGIILVCHVSMSVLQARSGGYSKSVAGSRCSLEVQREQPRLTLYVLKSMWWSAGKETQSRWRDRTAWRRRTAGPFQGRSCGAGLLQDSFLPRPARAPPARSEHAVQQAQCKLGVRKQSKDVGSATAVLTVLLRG